MTYTCNLCGANSDQSEFYAGVTCRCKDCHRRKVRENRAKNVEYYRAYDRMRLQRDAHRRAAAKAYMLTDRGKEVGKKARARFVAMSPEKRAAHVILNNAVRDRRVFKPKQCSRCLAHPPSRQLHGHHHDYTKPLDVEWICTVCHGKEHWGKDDAA